MWYAFALLDQCVYTIYILTLDLFKCKIIECCFDASGYNTMHFR